MKFGGTGAEGVPTLDAGVEIGAGFPSGGLPSEGGVRTAEGVAVGFFDNVVGMGVGSGVTELGGVP